MVDADKRDDVEFLIGSHIRFILINARWLSPWAADQPASDVSAVISQKTSGNLHHQTRKNLECIGRMDPLQFLMKLTPPGAEIDGREALGIGRRQIDQP
ncbi:hypothetical protein D3C80_1882250 [compost metagenome]